MIFSAITSGTAVFVDANVFIYAITCDPQYGAECELLLKRIENKQLIGYTSATALSDVAHRLLTIDAVRVFGWTYTGIGRRLKRHPGEFSKLSLSKDAIARLVNPRLVIVAMDANSLLRATEVTHQHGLLTNDALIIAAMEATNVTILASSDADFDRVPSITRASPI